MGFTMVLGLKPGHACDPIARLSGVRFLTGVPHDLCGKTAGADTGRCPTRLDNRCTARFH
jgi:hypothetical protein